VCFALDGQIEIRLVLRVWREGKPGRNVGHHQGESAKVVEQRISPFRGDAWETLLEVRSVQDFSELGESFRADNELVSF
jgi:hypothetical protein